MVFFTTSSLVAFDINPVNIIQVIVVLSTKCCLVSNHHPEPSVHYKGHSCVPNVNGNIFVARLLILYDYRHDLNSFTKQLLEDFIQQLDTPDEKVSVIIEEIW
jgi:hypothetical protein